MEIKYHEQVIKQDIAKLDSFHKKIIRQTIEKKLGTNPLLYGKPLQKSLKNYRKLRIGNYRVVFKIQNSQVFVIIIEHRSRIYTEIKKRMR